MRLQLWQAIEIRSRFGDRMAARDNLQSSLKLGPGASQCVRVAPYAAMGEKHSNPIASDPPVHTIETQAFKFPMNCDKHTTRNARAQFIYLFIGAEFQWSIGIENTQPRKRHTETVVIFR